LSPSGDPAGTPPAGSPEPTVSSKEPEVKNVEEINELNLLENSINKLRD